MEIGAWIEVAVALGTAALALITWRMARATADMASATREMARGSEDQLELLRRQATALEDATIQNQRRLESETLPRLNVIRAQGEMGAVDLDSEGRFSIYVRNDGPVSATVTVARIRLAPQEVDLEKRGWGMIGPGSEADFHGLIPPGLVDDVSLGRVPLPVRFEYHGPRAEPQSMEVTIRAAENGEAWPVIDRERHEP